MAEADGQGRTRHETLTRQLERARRKRATKRVAEIKSELTLPPFPATLAYLWRSYLRLRRRKGVAFSGQTPIEWPDIDAFICRSGIQLAPWEIEIIEAIDDAYVRPTAFKVEVPEGQTVKIMASANDAVGVKAIIGSIGVRRVVKKKAR